MNETDKEALRAAFECMLIIGLFCAGIWIVSQLDLSIVP